ncbi:RNA-guided endonuclease InsQ/TnpB family protein [Bifidobacterium callitrichidarum]|uniref:Cas12f1-like TNB domain-containing protein n=1 Tax=Bifidobacterium callitrichidarum TaxID=2052941 RepID=A0A2U2N0Q7_9BIFI|nr:RNA-guided endonuclease TnpB family protein [Bifidobacterium callitrichidarum]PWG62647.1 hypothetical protein DF196_11860 [Bifidobacterium callitrichidarum]
MRRSRTDIGWRTAVVPVRLEGESYRLAHEICHHAGLMWSRCVDWLRHYWHAEHKDPSNRELRQYAKTAPETILRGLHAHVIQHLVDDVQDAVATYRTNRDRNGDKDARAPYRHHNYRPVEFTKDYGWKLSKDGRTISLSRGIHRNRRLKPILIPTPEITDPKTGLPVPPTEWGSIQLCWDLNRRRWSLHVSVPTGKPAANKGMRPMSMDEGIINPVTCAVETSSSYEILVINGRDARAARQYRDTRIDQLISKRDRCVKGSRRWFKLDLKIRKARAIADGRIRNIAHQTSAKTALFAETLGVTEITAGDVRGIEQSTRKNPAKRKKNGKTQRRRLSQWDRGRIEDHIEHKTGLTVNHIDESYSSQTCPACLTRNRPTGREYRCSNCGFTCHRDAVGALNILQKHQYGQYTPIDMDKPIHVTYLRATPLKGKALGNAPEPGLQDPGRSCRTANPRTNAPTDTHHGKTPATFSNAGLTRSSQTTLRK